MKNQDCILEINHYIDLYGTSLSFKHLSIEDLMTNADILEECVDFIIDLFCEIGLRDDFEPNDEGYKLDKCLEFINSIRYKYHDPTT